MLPLLLSALLTGLAPVQDPSEDVAPSREKVEAAIEDLEQALRSHEPEERVRGLRRAMVVVHADVIRVVRRGLKDKERTVKEATIEALRWMHHPQALDALHGAYGKDRKLAKDDELLAGLLRAIGQHGSTDSITVLTDDPFKNTFRGVIRARILGLGNIRSIESVEGLMAMMRKAGRGAVQGYMGDFRLSLMRLTGTDRGKGREAWLRWWSENKKRFEVSSKPPALPRAERKRWNAYWGIDDVEERKKRREDRGDDPEVD